MEAILPAMEHLGHGQLYGNLTLDKLKSSWKEKRGSGGAVNSSEGCWRHSGKSLSSLCAGQQSHACRAEEGLSRVEKEEGGATAQGFCVTSENPLFCGFQL